MSFDIFLNVEDGEEVGRIPRALVEKAFAPFIEEREDDYNHWTLAGSNAEVWIKAEPEIGGFMVSRPPGEDHPFWAALLELMRKTPTVLYWPAAGPKPYCAVANESVTAKMPADMIEALGTPKLIEKPEDFLQAIYESDV
jgi:hypothetical protein